ncbi:beta strand repeat-containing protein [Arthrobacter sp. 135MFCol5.1]|uniref:beta strand repeat-containing protein n=1 Tax=Arthrobacter sp. 135MFCol5.1 TaxID=1158050 RepID=UPI0003663661|nr:Ig-like domain-containing protein [Arthrobacter sp. 135MFCol5.1]
MRFLLLRRPSRRLPWIVTALLLLLGTGTAAYAFWASSTSSSNAAAAADTLSPGSKPAVTAAGSALTVTWAGGTTVNGRAATGYTVARYSAATGGTATPATGGCAGTVTTLTCTELSVPGGIWYYTVTPAIALWTGAESPRSNGTSSDSTAPVATVSGISPTPNAAGWNTTSPVSVTVTADDGAAGSGVASISYVLDGGAQQTVSGAVANVPVSGDGTHTLTYFATDKVGNAGSAQSQTVRIDTQAPAAPAFTPPAYVNAGNVGAVPLTGTAEAGSKVTLVASDPGSAHSISATVTASGTGTWSASLDLTSLNQGAVTYSATATDAAGNTSPAKTATSTKDTVAPAAAQFSSVPQYVNSAGVGSVPVAGTAETGAVVTVSAMSPGSAAVVTGTATATASGWAVNLNLTSLRDGTVTYTVTVTDSAGNASVPATTTDTKDTVAPVLTITAPMYVNLSNYTAVQISGTTDTTGLITVTARSSVAPSVTKQVSASGASWSTSMDLASLDQGILTFTASLTDAAGNTGSATAASSTTKDTVAPTIMSIVLANGGTVGTADAGDTITIVYSEFMDATKFCSSWTTPGTQNLNANNDVTVTFNHTSSTNSMTVSSKTCTLNVGTISLGATANYASTTSPVVFVGANAGASTVSWNPATNTLIVRLGSPKNNTGAQGTNIAADVPVYTASSSLTDAAGNPFATANSPSGASRF